MRRGHPKMEIVPYDSHRRRGMIDSLRSRDRFQPALKANKNGNLIVFKVEFGPHLKSLEIRERCRNLYCSLRHIYGQTFLQDERTILAHPVRTNKFLKHYNYTLDFSTFGDEIDYRSELKGVSILYIDSPILHFFFALWI